MTCIATLPLYRKWRSDVSSHPLVDELRFNTITPLDDSIEATLDGLIRLAGDKPLWLDLKCRQLRIVEFDYIPYSYVKISHCIKVKTPCRVLFKDGESVIEEVVDGNKLIIQRPPRVVGKGEPINIPDESLEVEGFLTEQDKRYIEAFRDRGHHRYMLSFFQKQSDGDEVLALDPKARLIGKIEDQRGLDFIGTKDFKNKSLRLMAAADDLYINLKDKTDFITAMKNILARDRSAIAASRLFTSVYDQEMDVIKNIDHGDIAYFYLLCELGFRNFMISDNVCRLKDVFQTVMKHYGVCSEKFIRRGLW